MKNSQKVVETERISTVQGNFEITLNGSREKKIRLIFHQEVSGIKELVFVFIRNSKRRIISAFIKRKPRLDIEKKMATLRLIVPRLDFENDEKLVAYVSKIIESRIKGNNSEMLAFRLFSEISRTNLRVKTPKIPTGLLDKHFHLLVPAITSETGTIIDVPVQVKSSIDGQEVHKKKYPLIPSIVIFEGMVTESKKEKAKELLFDYLKGKINHI